MGIGFNIRKIAQQQPHKKAIIYGKDVLTYGQLYDTICHIQTYLHTCKNVKKRQIISAGAKLSPKRKNELHNLFPNGSIYEYYGASELSFVTRSEERRVGKECR